MDDCDDYSDYEDYDSGGDVFDEEDDFDDDNSGGEEDLVEEQQPEEEEDYEEEEEEEEEEEVEEEDYEEEDGEDEMEDYEEEEEFSENSEQHNDDEIVEDHGVELEDGAEEERSEFEEEEEEDQLMEEEIEEEEELLEEEEGDEEVSEDEDSYEDETDYEDEIAAAEPLYLPRPTTLAPFPVSAEFSGRRPRIVEIGLLDLIDGRRIGTSGSYWSRSESGGGTASSSATDNNVSPSVGNVVESRGTESSGSNESNGAGFHGAICPICFECWSGEGQHCVCCLPCGHLYGLSCIKMWLERPNSQKCPQCNEPCQLADVRRLYGMQLAINGAEELQQKVKILEEKCASLELKDADWLRKETEWQKREADLQEQLNQRKEAGLVNNVIPRDTRERPDPSDDPGPANAFRQMKL